MRHVHSGEPRTSRVSDPTASTAGTTCSRPASSRRRMPATAISPPPTCGTSCWQRRAGHLHAQLRHHATAPNPANRCACRVPGRSVIASRCGCYQTVRWRLSARAARCAEETEIRGVFGAHLVADEFELSPGEAHEWITSSPTPASTIARLVDLRASTRGTGANSPRTHRKPGMAEHTRCCAEAHRRGRRVAANRPTARPACIISPTCSSTVMRGGTLHDSYRFPRSDFSGFPEDRATRRPAPPSARG